MHNLEDKKLKNIERLIGFALILAALILLVQAEQNWKMKHNTKKVLKFANS